MILKHSSKEENDILLHEEKVTGWMLSSFLEDNTGINGFVTYTIVNLAFNINEILEYGPRIKFAKKLKSYNNHITIPLFGKPRIIGNLSTTKIDFLKMMKWITLNKIILLEHWNDEISTGGLIREMRKI